MTREEAIDTVRRCCPHISDSECYFETAMRVLVPELAESEDERIRKFLIWIVENVFDNIIGLSLSEEKTKDLIYKFNGIQTSDILSWLEKQKEPHFTKRNALFDECVAKCDPAVMKKVSDDVDEMLKKEQKPVEYLSKRKVYDIMNKLTELSTSDLIPVESEEYVKIHEITSDVCSLLNYPIEQKPTEKSETPNNLNLDEEIADYFKDPLTGRPHIEWIDGVHMAGSAILEFAHHFYELGCKSKPTAWDEKDEDMFGSVMMWLDECEPQYVYKDKAWLESVKERLIALHPQSKPEWSEEDSRIWNNIWDVLDGPFQLSEEGYKEAAQWFKVHCPYGGAQSQVECNEEDERIRKNLIYAINTYGEKYKVKTFAGHPIVEFIAWLEKQKDASKAIEAVDRIDKYIVEHVANAHDMKDSNPDKKYYRGYDDALGKIAGILQDVYSGEKKKESLRDFIDNFPYSDERKEQNSVEWSDTDNIGWDEAFACVTRAEKAAKNEEELQNAVTAEKWLKEIKFKYYVHPVKQEWSEEDEHRRTDAIYFLESAKSHYADTSEIEKTILWLKSLRPQPRWKPSEEQMEALKNSAYGTYQNGDGPALRELYEQLKKLM